MMDFQEINAFVTATARCTQNTPRLPRSGEKLHVGLDLGTCLTVLVVLGEDMQPLACEMERSDALRDGVVVDYLQACKVVRRLKEQVEAKLGVELEECAIAMPPGTEMSDSRPHMYVASSTGMEVTAVVDEPSAANLLLNMENGAVVDIGGGTTGISVIKDHQVVHVADEPTGGTHLSLVIAGARNTSYEEAELFKMDLSNQQEVLFLTTPVIEKMGQILLNEIRGHDVREVCLVGGTCCLDGLEKVFSKYTKLEVYKPENPLLITPVGIAMAHK